MFCVLQEYYAYIDGESGNQKLGFFAWLYASLAVVETAIVVKFGRGETAGVKHMYSIDTDGNWPLVSAPPTAAH